MVKRVDSILENCKTQRKINYRRRQAERMTQGHTQARPSNLIPFLAMTVVALQTSAPTNAYGEPIHQNNLTFNTDSAEVGIDN